MPKLLDLTGKTFGRLKVISQAGRNKHGSVIWKCECSCGKNTNIVSQCLRSGNTKSCGCLAIENRYKSRPEKLIDLSGERFGRLIVIGKVNKDNRGYWLWQCVCDCRGSKVVLGSSLRAGYTKSCGCLQKEVMKEVRLVKIDRRKNFDRLKIIAGPIKKGSKTFYKCLCVCGTFVEVESYTLRKGITQSCGCLHKEAITTHGKSQTKEYKAAKAAERRAAMYHLGEHYTVVDVEQKFIDQKGLCFYCDKDLSISGFHREHMIPLSRGGSNNKDNLCLSCPDCNLKKNTKTADEFLASA